MKKALLISTLFLSLFLIIQATALAIPKLISYQGTLHDADGQPISSTINITFSVYNAETGGEAIWSETQNVSVSNGLFNVMLGSVTPISSSVFQNDLLYLGIQVAADPEMAPRQRFTSGSFSYIAETVANKEVPVGTVIKWLKNTTDSIYTGNITNYLDKMLIDENASFQEDLIGKRCDIVYPVTSFNAILSDEQTNGVLVDNVTFQMACQHGYCTTDINFFYTDGTSAQQTTNATSTSWEARDKSNPNPSKLVWKIVTDIYNSSINDFKIRLSPGQKHWSEIIQVSSPTQLLLKDNVEEIALSSQCTYEIRRTPSLFTEWVEMNGQTLVDEESPYNNYVIPDLNTISPCEIPEMTWIMKIK